MNNFLAPPSSAYAGATHRRAAGVEAFHETRLCACSPIPSLPPLRVRAPAAAPRADGTRGAAGGPQTGGLCAHIIHPLPQMTTSSSSC